MRETDVLLCTYMIIFLYGEETYQLFHKVQKIKKDYAMEQMHGTVFVHDCDEEYDPKNIIQSIAIQDLFAQKKIVIIKNYFAHAVAAEQKIMQQELSRPTQDVIVFWEEGMPRKNAPLFLWLNANAEDIFLSAILNDGQLEKWIDKYTKSIGGQITRDAIMELIAYVGNDLWHIATEIEKLVTYTGNTAIDVHHVQEIVHGKVDADMFATIEAICGSRKDQAIHLLRKQRAKGDDAFHIFSMYAYQIRLLLRVSSVVNEMGISDKGDIAKILKIHPFVAQKSIAVVRVLSESKLKKAHHMLTVFDHEIKTGKRDADTALDLLLISL